MTEMSLYPLRFETVFQYRPWGGRRLAKLLGATLPGEDPIGESWLLSDRAEHSSVIANGALKGQTLGQLLRQWPEQLVGKRAVPFPRFPLLLKFLDVRGSLSVQVHPTDEEAASLPEGDSGKTEAWVVMAAGDKARIYAGLTPHTSAQAMRAAITEGTVADHLASFAPKPGDGIFIPARTVHSLCDVVVFEVQENSDVTLRLFDWNQIDAQTQRRRPLQVEQAMACIDFTQGAIGPVAPIVEEEEPVLRERLFDDPHFRVWRLRAGSAFSVGKLGLPRVLVCLDGQGHLKFDGADYPLTKGEVMLLPAAVGVCRCQPEGSLCLLEIALPDGA